jgi:hypothetical protein
VTVCSPSAAAAPRASPRGAARVQCAYPDAALARVATVEHYRVCYQAVQTGVDSLLVETPAGCPEEQAATACLVAELAPLAWYAGFQAA